MESNIAFLCADIGRQFRKHFSDAARECGPTGAQWRVLLFLQRMPGISQGALAEQMDVEPITACRMVDRLEQAGLVERRRDPRDRRVWQLFLTASAEPVVEELKTIGMEMLDWVTSDLTEEEEALVCSYLMKIRDRFALLDERKQVRETSNG
ncbi:MAG: MarR family transcriptional regulator [Sphingobium sp.]|jgi:DNA-binding MarR family transcriptional regulator|nr:MarR family transcriptional regulator [Sphingobium sp.]MCI1271423.1 MarR family transcriptional regulator [Sphingobium sp.]MCI1755640.1 MarR family transcriptional regulator [Sphingobium sp.]MCI2052536.1 MarR family transcriptional regulator [Sphingobium sp.]